MAARCPSRQVPGAIRVSTENHPIQLHAGLPERLPKPILDMRSRTKTYAIRPNLRISNRGTGIGFLRGLVATIVIMTAGLVPLQSADPADVAFETGQHDRALELYDARLDQNPDDVAALVQSGLLLSWRNEFAEAVTRYERALALQPGHPRASLERAKVLSWDQRFAEAVDAFGVYLGGHPEDLNARLGLARCLSWMRRFDESRQEFDVVLQQDPDNLDAIIGSARTYAWSGDLRSARKWFERALDVEPRNRDAGLGLAYLYLWSGAPARADEQAWRLQRRHPTDGEVAQLTLSAARAAAPTAVGEVERIEDTDDNVLNIARVTGGVALLPTVGLGFAYTHWDLNNRETHADIDYLSASVGMRPALGQSLSVTLGIDHSDNDINDETQTDLLGGVDYSWGLDRPWQVTGAAGRQALRYSPEITSNNIRIDYLTAGVRGRVADRWRPFVDAGYSDYSDGNSRTNLLAGFTYEWPMRSPHLYVGSTIQLMSFAENTNSGYFDPQNFISPLINARINGRFGSSNNTWRAAVETGVQSFELNDIKIDNEFVVVVTGVLGFPIGRHFILEAQASWGNYAALTTAGFESRQLGLRLRWRGGP